MADRVDAPVEHAQPPLLDATLDLPSADPGREKLGTGDHPVLGIRERRDHVIGSLPLQFATYVVVKCRGRPGRQRGGG